MKAIIEGKRQRKAAGINEKHREQEDDDYGEEQAEEVYQRHRQIS
jgi:hypothetical protein